MRAGFTVRQNCVEISALSGIFPGEPFCEQATLEPRKQAQVYRLRSGKPPEVDEEEDVESDPIKSRMMYFTLDMTYFHDEDFGSRTIDIHAVTPGSMSSAYPPIKLQVVAMQYGRVALILIKFFL